MKALLCGLLLILHYSGICQEEFLTSSEETILEDAELGSLNLNLTDKQTLQDLTTLSVKKIKGILEYRDMYGPFISPLELQVVDELSAEDIQQLLATFYIKEDRNFTPAHDTYIMLRYKQNSAIDLKDFSGKYVMIRSQFKVGDAMKVALTLEKDYREKLDWENENRLYLADHIAGYVKWEPNSRLQLIAGNYTVHFGQGLVIGSGFSLGKNSNRSLAGRPAALIGYRGLQESFAKWGAGINLNTKGLNSGLFISSMFHDAKLYIDQHGEYIRSIQTSGIHSSRGERESRKTINRKTIGAYTVRSRGPFNLGLIVKYDQLSRPMRLQPGWYDYFGWSGRKLLSGSAYASYNNENVVAWAEVAYTSSGKQAVQSGLMASIGRRWTTSLLIRSYEPGYYAFDSRAFGERTSQPDNENGIYFELNYSPRKRWDISACFDLFQFPWLSYTASSPGFGNEMIVRSTWRSRQGITLIADYRREEKTNNIPEKSGILPLTGQRVNKQYGLFAGWKFSNAIEWRVRIRNKRSGFDKNWSKGSSAYCELICSIGKLNISYRYCIFDTDNYDSRIYFFERDLWGSFTLPALQGKGYSQYMLIRYSVSQHLDIWLRFSQKRQQLNENPTGTATKNLLSCQLRIKL